MPEQGEERERVTPPRHVVWSTDTVDLSDPFQRTWYIRQVLLHGRAEDIRCLDLAEVARLLGQLRLPAHILSLWRRFLKEAGYAPG